LLTADYTDFLGTEESFPALADSGDAS
jgi:hypothetical protein